MLMLVYNEHVLAFNVLTSYDESLQLQTVQREREREGVGRGPLVSTFMGVLELM